MTLAIRRRAAGLIVLVALLDAGCALHAPPTLSPMAQAQWRGTQILRSLAAFRDGVVAFHDQFPTVLDAAVTEKVVGWHRGVVQLIEAYPEGAVPIIRTGLVEVLKLLPRSARETVDPYVQLVLAILGGG